MCYIDATPSTEKKEGYNYNFYIQIKDGYQWIEMNGNLR